MNKLDKQYTDLLQDILDNGVTKSDRTGTGTISVFGRQIRHKMKDGFPLLTTKKMAWKTMVTELIWFLNGDTNIKFLVDNNCHIWDGDAYKNFVKTIEDNRPDGYTRPILTQEEFIKELKHNDEFAKKWGELGPVYGKQWREWGRITYNDENRSGFYNPIDQIANLINELKTNPDSRRLMVSAWNVGELDQMTLPPCHYGFQVYTRELSIYERAKIYAKKNNTEVKIDTTNDYTTLHLYYTTNNIPTRAISLMWNQRSVDTFLGLPFNIASYGLLLEIIAKEVNMVPDELIGNLGDTHLYLNHVDQAKEQIGREYTSEERHEMLKTAMGDFYKTAVDEQVPFGGGLSEYYDSYKIPNHTREPYPLPTLNINTEFWQTESGECGVGPLATNLLGLEISDFTLENYQSHPTIKAPLSN